MQHLGFLKAQGDCLVGSSDFPGPAGFGLEEFAA